LFKFFLNFYILLTFKEYKGYVSAKKLKDKLII